MTIACTRCGATCEGDFISAPLAFTFKHDAGCGHGVGPLAVLPGAYKAKQKKEFKKTAESHAEKQADEIIKTVEKEEIKVEEKVEKSKSIKEKIKVFGKKE